jgi:hypothetical protein
MTGSEFHGLSLIRIERDGLPQPENVIELRPGERVTNLRLIAVYGTILLRGEINIVGGTLPKNKSLYITASRVNAATRDPNGSAVDARNQFTIGGLSPGEYELRVGLIRGDPPDQPDTDPKLRQKISQFRQKVVVNTDNQHPVILTLDLSQ